MDLSPLKTAIRDRLRDVQAQVAARTPAAVYHTLVAATFLPIVAAFNQGDVPTLIAVSQVLGQIATGLGGNLLANKIDAWKQEGEDEVKADLARLLETNAEARAQAQQVVERLDTLALAQEGLNATDKAWLADTLNREMGRQGVGRGVTVGDQGILVWGDRNVVAQTMHHPVIQSGDHAIYIKEQHVHHPPAPPDTKAEVLRHTYLSGLFRDMGTLDLSVMEQQLPLEQQTDPDLAAVYTHLDTLRSQDRRGSKRPGGLSGWPGKDKQVSALEFVNQTQYAVLLGGPGSGKTTFARYLALCLAGERLGRREANLSHLKGWRGQPIPVFVTLRHFAASGKLRLWDYITDELAKNNLADFAPHLETDWRPKDGGLLILDGLDEFPNAQQRRQEIKAVIQTVQTAFPQLRILLTSRTYAYDRQGWRLPDFEEAVLAPFSPEQIDQFIEAWYAHLQTRRGLRPEEAAGLGANLKDAVRRLDHLKALAERPLLLTLMASLHASSRQLPESREELYHASVELLLNAWEGRKVVLNPQGEVVLRQPSLSEWLRIPHEELERTLERVAFEAHDRQPRSEAVALEGTADIEEKDLVYAIHTLAKKHHQDISERAIIEYISERAGLLIHHANEKYTFPHRTFQEYLAARYLTQQDFPTLLVEKTRQDPPRWREAVRLAGAKVTRGGTPFAGWALVDCLCPYPPTPQRVTGATDGDWWAALLAGQVLEETRLYQKPANAANHRTLANVRHWLRTLCEGGHLPPGDRAAAGRALGVLGDPRPGVGVTTVNGRAVPDLEWVTVPAGPFLMGSRQGQTLSALGETYPIYDDETPQFTCHLIQQPYRLSRYPVTVAQYDLFIKANGYANKDYWTAAGWAWRTRNGVEGPVDFAPVFQTPNHPRVGVSWYEAVAFCHWLAQALDRPKGYYRLPTEAEWERAARGTGGRLWPWGDEFDTDRCNAVYSGIGATCAVGIFPRGDTLPDEARPRPLSDMAGNVWEWCATVWRENYDHYEQEADDILKSDDPRVLRGGGWYVGLNYVRCACRLECNPDRQSDDLGFRLASPASESLNL